MAVSGCTQKSYLFGTVCLRVKSIDTRSRISIYTYLSVSQANAIPRTWQVNQRNCTMSKSRLADSKLKGMQKGQPIRHPRMKGIRSAATRTPTQYVVISKLRGYAAQGCRTKQDSDALHSSKRQCESIQVTLVTNNAMHSMQSYTNILPAKSFLCTRHSYVHEVNIETTYIASTFITNKHTTLKYSSFNMWQQPCMIQQQKKSTAMQGRLSISFSQHLALDDMLSAFQRVYIICKSILFLSQQSFIHFCAGKS